MSQQVLIELEVPDELKGLHMPEGVHRRLQGLLDRQDSGKKLTADERSEAEGLVTLAELLSLLRLRAEQAAKKRGRR